MIDENNTQQQITPQIVFENVIAALTLAEDFLVSTENVGEFNNLVKSKTRSLGNESHFWSSIQYGQAKAAVAETGDGLGKDFIKKFLPKHAIPRDETLQTAIDSHYAERRQAAAKAAKAAKVFAVTCFCRQRASGPKRDLV